MLADVAMSSEAEGTPVQARILPLNLSSTPKNTGAKGELPFVLAIENP